MLDLKRIRNDLEQVKAAMARRGEAEVDLDAVLAVDEKRRILLQEVEQMKSEQNAVSREIPLMKKAGEDTTEIMAKMKGLSARIKALDGEVAEVDSRLYEMMLRIPNVPHPDVPQGETEEDNVEVRTWGTPTAFTYEAKAHWDIGTDLDILDFERAAKVTGARFVLYKGLGSRLERALINFMLDLHITEHGYTELMPPFMVNRQSMIGTGQLPKFEEDTFRVPQKDYFLVPTAEVPVTNIHRD
ncbi:MAG: serine--tRNA ligase, partial [Bacillota bacterium]|nr:serine--tRNA ligase [Bacillota bacterium]